MIARLIEASLRHRFLVICLTLLIVALGVRAMVETPIDAIPDLSENQVIVFADWPGRSPQEVEDQVTYPLSVNLQGLARVKTVRASSMFGFSLITVVFDEGVDNYFARERILERLSYLTNALPTGVEAKLGPDATGLGWIYQYYLEVDSSRVGGAGSSSSHSGAYDLGELRSVQDWFVRYQLNAVQGVAEVASIGGFVKQYQIEVDPRKMRALGVTLSMVMTAVERSNLNVGGKTIEENGMEFIVRGVGLVKNVTDLEKIVLLERDGAPVYLNDVARIEIGGDFRRGTLDVNGAEVVGGIVVMRTGENAHDVIARVKAKIAEITPSLPPGISIRAFYDRSELIDRTTETLRAALIEEVILVTLAHIVFLFHFRSILIVTLPLPVAILISFILMNQFGITSNIMSLSGIAIAVGVLVDAAIVLTENVIRHAEEAERRLSPRRRLTPAETMIVVRDAAQQVGRPIFFAMAIIVLAFVPVFALTGQEGKLFRPLAFTKTFAMIGSTLLAVTIVPVLGTLLVRGPFHAEGRNMVMRLLLRVYEPALDFALRRRAAVIATAAALLASAFIIAFGLPASIVARLAPVPQLQQLVSGIGSEFMPPLNEGSILIMPTFVPATALSEVKRVMAWQDRVIAETPEVRSVAGKLGRADTATDPAPIEMIETTIMLKPEREWRPGMTRQMLVAELSEKMRLVPGAVPGFLQPIENRVLMISTGIRAQLGVKIFGENLDALQKIAFDVERIVKDVRGATGVAPSRVQGKPFLEVEVNREAMARFGLQAQDVLEAVETGLGGTNVTTTIEGRARYPIQVRFERSVREDLTRLKDVLVSSQSGKVIPLGQVAAIRRVEGPNEIASENGRLRVFVQANVEGRDLGGFVAEIKDRVTREILPHLPKGMTIEYSGEFENQIRAAQTLRVIVPTVLLVIFMLLYLVYGNAREAAHVILAVPFALSGGVFLQYLMGYNFSVAVWVGYIALFGTAIQTGVVMVVYLEEAVARKKRERGGAFSHTDLIAAVKEGARTRLRPKIMTVATIVASLLPIMWSTRAGAEVMKPLATPVIGGMVSSLLHVLIVTPVLFAWIRSREMRSLGQ
jgi:Cu(I)/Ag(I) efflux system membrane protein CusA/SilA